VNKSEKNDRRLFLSIFLLIAIVASGIALKLEVDSAAKSRQAANDELRARKMAADAEAEHVKSVTAHAQAVEAHDRYLSKYLNSKLVRQPGIEAVAIVIASDDESFNTALDAAFDTKFTADSIKILPEFFTHAFVADGLFAELFNGSLEVINKLELTNSLDSIILVKRSLRYDTSADLNNLITANMQLDLITIPIAAKGRKQALTFISNGPGFTQEAARKIAEDRILKQIADSTNLSLPMPMQNNRIIK
jgi:hypothetical protein